MWVGCLTLAMYASNSTVVCGGATQWRCKSRLRTTAARNSLRRRPDGASRKICISHLIVLRWRQLGFGPGMILRSQHFRIIHTSERDVDGSGEVGALIGQGGATFATESADHV